MRRYEFKVVPVPSRCGGNLGQGQDRVAATLETVLNALAFEGWEFHAIETLSMRANRWLPFARRIERDVLVLRRERVTFGQLPDTVEDRIEKTRNRKPRTDAGEDGAPKPRRIRPALPPAAVA